jgi:hypothetical protein
LEAVDQVADLLPQEEAVQVVPLLVEVILSLATFFIKIEQVPSNSKTVI